MSNYPTTPYRMTQGWVIFRGERRVAWKAEDGAVLLDVGRYIPRLSGKPVSAKCAATFTPVGA